MKKLELLLGDVLEATTGVRRPPEREAGQETAFEKKCMSVAAMVGEHREELLELFIAKHVNFPDDMLLPNNSIAPMIEECVVDFVASRIQHFTLPERDRILHFLRPGIDFICFLSFSLNNRKAPLTPVALLRKQPHVVHAAELLSRYPQEISSTFKHMLAANIFGAMKDNDITDDFAQEVREILIDGILHSPQHLDAVQKLRSCPSRTNVKEFSETIFLLLHDVYRQIYERHSGPHGEFLREKIFELHASLFGRSRKSP